MLDLIHFGNLKNSNKMIEILHVVGGVGTGGVEILLLNYYKHIDRTKIHWNIVTPVDSKRKEKGLAEVEFEKLGATIYYMPRKNPHFIKQLFVFDKLLKTHHFDIIHCHLDELCSIYLTMAKRRGIKVRIAHCHVAHTQRGRIFEIVSAILKPYLNNSLTDKFACSLDAAKFLYGSTDNVFIMHNAIDTKKIVFNEGSRMLIRKKYEIPENVIVMGCVGRFTYQKNHEMLLKIFSEFQKLCNAKLLLVGNGEIEDEVKKMAKDFGVLNNTIFAGITTHVEEYLSAMDCFVMPSRFEGLGIVYIESLSTNLLTYATAERVPHEVAISSKMHFLSINATPKTWAEDIYKQLQQQQKRTSDNTFVEEAGYEIVSAAKVLENKYTLFYHRLTED